MGMVLFEILTGRRMFTSSKDTTELGKILRNEIQLPSSVDPKLAPWDGVVHRAAGMTSAHRYPTARAMAQAVEKVCGVASTTDVAEWVERLAGPTIEQRTRRIAEIESQVSSVRMSEASVAEEVLRSSPSSQGSLPQPTSQPGFVGSQPGFTGSQPGFVGSQPGFTGSQPGFTGSHPGYGSHPAYGSDPRLAAARPVRTSMVLALVGGGSLLVLALVIGAFWAGKSGGGTVTTAGSATGASTSTGAGSAAGTVATAGAGTGTTAGAAASTSAAADATAIAAAPTVTSALAPIASAAPKPTPVAAAHPTARPKPKVDCDPPYTVDKQGHQHFKPECL